MLGCWPRGNWWSCSSSFLASSSSFPWIATSWILVFIHALMDWIWWLLGPSRSSTLNEDPTRIFSTCLAGVCGVVPNWSCRWVFGTGLDGGVGVKAGSLVRADGLCSPGCKGERRWTWLLVVRQGVRVPDSSAGGASEASSASGWESTPSCWVGLIWHSLSPRCEGAL